MLQYKPDLHSDHIVLIRGWRGETGAKRRVDRFVNWARLPELQGAFQYSEVGTDMIARFDNRDTAFCAEIMFGSIFEQKPPKEKFRYSVAFEGPMRVTVLAELRDWIAGLDEDTWSMEIEQMMDFSVFEERRIIVMRFTTRADAFAFKLRWTLPHD